jgi:DNA-binding response OmpR family regulator
MGTHATTLLVDHDPTTADVLRAALANEPYAFDVAYDVATAIRCLDSERYGGVIVDLALPHAFEVLRHMTSRGIALPTVVILSHLPESVRATLARENVTLVLPKPTETWLLLNVLRGLCGLSEADTPRRRRPTLPRRRALPPALQEDRAS